jgi:hypothetical protein
MTYYTLIITVALASYQSTPLPPNARALVDKTFPGWTYQTRNSEGPLSASQTLITCFLNEDSLPDYALHIVIPKDSTEHFIALLSQGHSFSLYRLETHRGDAGIYWYYMFYTPRGDTITNFGFEDENNLPEGHKPDVRTVFPTDCITVVFTDKNACTSYIFERNRFRSFSSCD